MTIFIEILDSNEVHILELTVSVNATTKHIKSQIITGEIDNNTLSLYHNGICLLEEDVICDGSYLRGFYSDIGIYGGKGGFGAILKSKAKQKGAKATTDFGACRDLNGRRLRHVNDEIIAQKYKEAKERGEKFKPDDDTPTGIEMWYLSKPNWADVPGNARSKHRKKVFKTEMCYDWLSARETETPPADAPIFWGCPRGIKCQFAHGIDELRGEEKERLLKEKKEEKISSEQQGKLDYLAASALAVDNDSMDDKINATIAESLKAAKLNNISTSSVRLNKLSSAEKIPEDNEILPFDDYGF